MRDMNTVQRIAKNTAVLFISEVIGKILGFLYIMYTARYLGPVGLEFYLVLVFTGKYLEN